MPDRPEQAAPCWEKPSPLVQAALDDPTAGIVIFNAALELTHVSSQVGPLLGLTPEDLKAIASFPAMLDRSSLDAPSIAAARSVVDQLEPASNTVSVQTSIENTRLEMHCRDIGRHYRLASFRPQSKVRANATAEPRPAEDFLTGLATRATFELEVRTTLATRDQAQPVTILLLDLDRFKAVNDTLGHDAGDALLRIAAKRLRSVVRETDLVARLGGDEFAMLVQAGAEPLDAAAIARRLVDLIGRTYLIEGHLVNVGVSIGIAQSPGDSDTFEGLLRSADLALYHSKSRGRGIYHFFSPEMEERAQARRTSELDLRRALALRQLEVFYQPQVDIATRRLIGFEALLRWRHPERGLIPPNEFLPIAEEIGVIIPIGDWVLRTACREAMRWPQHVVVAVNASPLQFDTGRFADSVRAALEQTGLPGSRLEIEITEGTLLRNEESVLQTVEDLRALGVRIAMDDFGTGYASLSQLARFPFDKIKIDKSLAGFGGESSKHRAIVRAISSLGESLGVSTMAEGIETAEQLERIYSDGCGSVQGFLFSKPVPAHHLGELIRNLTSTNPDASTHAHDPEQQQPL